MYNEWHHLPLIGERGCPLREHIVQEAKLLMENRRVAVVAVSGGLDSVTLLHLLSSVAKELGLSLVVGHVNHQLRGANSDADAVFVRELSAKLGWPCRVETVDVRGYSGHRAMSEEAAARELRYAALLQIAKEFGAEVIALAHHGDDQAETVLWRIIRGTSVRGLSAMRQIDQRGEVTLWRPLLPFRRQSVEAYAERHRIHFREDESNHSRRYTRNRLRHELLPLLRHSYNPSVDDALRQLAALSEADQAYMEEAAQRLFKSGCVVCGHASVAIRQKTVTEAPLALQRRVVTLILYKLYSGSDSSWNFDHVESVLRVFHHSSPSVHILLAHGVTVRRRYDEVLFVCGNQSPDLDEKQGMIPLVVPGVTHWCNGRWRFQSKLIQPPWNVHDDAEGSRIYIDVEQLSGCELALRRRKSGDRIQPYGTAYEKKLKDLFIDQKIPRDLREDWPLLVAGDRIVWVAGIRRSVDFSITETTTRVLRVEVESTVWNRTGGTKNALGS